MQSWSRLARAVLLGGAAVIAALLPAAAADAAKPKDDRNRPLRMPAPPPPPPGEDTRQPASTGAEYRVRPGDVLRVTVWKEPELSGDVTVRPDGKITVPLIGDTDAWLRTTGQIGEDLSREFARFVEEPQVTVAILQANSARFFIIGQVGKAGAYPLLGQTSVLQAIALAGGFSPFAKRDRMMLFRGVDGSDGVVQIDFEKIAAGDIRQNFVLQPGDTIVVP